MAEQIWGIVFPILMVGVIALIAYKDANRKDKKNENENKK